MRVEEHHVKVPSADSRLAFSGRLLQLHKALTQYNLLSRSSAANRSSSLLSSSSSKAFIINW